MKKLAFLGTGLMGLHMARHLAAAFEVTVWNRTAEKAASLADVAHIAATPQEAARGADVVISMLLDGKATQAVLREQGAIAAAADGALIINMGSVEPDCDRTLADWAKTLDKTHIDAPVSGGVQGAKAASLAIFVGGDVQSFERANPVLSLLGRPSLMGGVGAGQVAKLANQLIVAISIGAVAEAFRLAQSAGCDPAQLRQALKGGFADSRILDLHGERMVTGNFIPGGRSAAQLKDIDNALNVAKEGHLSLPLAQSVRHSFADLVENHDGADLDHAAYYLWLELQNKKPV